MNRLYAYGGLFFGLLLLALIWWFYKKGVAGVTSATVSAVGEAATGAVTGIAKTVGIPETSTDKCSIDQAAGDYWNASFDCAAGTFVKGIFNKVFSTQPLTNGGSPE